jgi:UDP-3-O-[3-hydroxymyristoyl] glucosamine N-acyltransferase
VGQPLSQLAALVGGQIEGDATLVIDGLAGLEVAHEGQLSFFGNPRYKLLLAQTRASVVLVGEDAPPRGAPTYVRVKNPHLAFARIARAFFPQATYAPGVSPRAEVHPLAQVDATATVMAFAVVGAHARIGARAVLFPGVYVGEHAQVGAGSVLHPNVTLEERCVVGARCILHASSVVGSDGFGFALDLEKPEHLKIPQAGIARLEDDVELGACSTIDRATLGETVVGQGTKIDNLVQVAHNVRIGPLSILCAQAGISGSSELGQGVVLAGQVGVVGHVKLGDLARVGAQSGVTNDVPAGATVTGSPAVDHAHFLRVAASLQRLPELVKELRALKKRVAQLEGTKGQDT